MKPLAGSAPLAWLAFAGATVAAAWPLLFGTEVPLPGLRNLSTPAVGWPLAIAALVMAWFLSTPRLLSRDRLLICAGVSLCLFVVVVIYGSPAFAMVFGFIAGNIMRQSKQAPSVPHPRHSEE